MNAIAVIVFLAALVAVNAGLVVPAGNILQGPSTRTTVVGPDGSVISALAPGGQVITEGEAGAVAQAIPVAHVQAAPLVAAPLAAAPLVAPVLPLAHELEGQYVHDNTEALFDDGSYKPHLY
ncbi:hypothetical protein NQ318_018694 [Aromia moschata]|uniref:Uncharacterized protein n=1 Tax=Aromia moschata TaxID=1265417 RepID=A0AAV8ZHJ4_9CUCU|nr:hypothetical protein NQ318_018694 [Aromia moschata]